MPPSFKGRTDGIGKEIHLPNPPLAKKGQGGFEKMFINAELIKRGYAYVYTRFPFKRMAEFLRLEKEAREKHYGVWKKQSGKVDQPRQAFVISWNDAEKYYGEYKVVEGRVVATHNSGKACFLNFSHNYKEDLTAVIFASSFPHFPANPEKYYYGKMVRVSGYIKKYKGKPEIVLNNPGQIDILK